MTGRLPLIDLHRHRVWAAVRHLGVERVGRGVRAVEDPVLLEHPAAHAITLDVALTINTDDPRVSNVTLSQEQRTAVTEVGLTTEQLRTVAEQSVRAAFTDLGTVGPRPSSTRQR